MFRRFAIYVGLLSPSLSLAASSENQQPVLVSHETWRNLKELQQIAEKGNPKAQYELALILEKGGELPKDLPRALTLYASAGENGEPNGWFRLGMIYDDGLGVTKDSAAAIEYFKKAASAGIAEAQYNLGTMYVGGHGTKRDWVEGLAWLIVATKNGANGDGEARVREHLGARPATVAAAEKRAKEIMSPPTPADIPPTLDITAPTPDAPPARLPMQK